MAAALHAEPRSEHRVYGTAVAVLPSKRNFVVFRCGIQTRIWSSSLEKDHLTHRDAVMGWVEPPSPDSAPSSR
jgi:hypothetical protein